MKRKMNSSRYASTCCAPIPPWCVPSSHRLTSGATRCTAGSTTCAGSLPFETALGVVIEAAARQVLVGAQAVGVEPCSQVSSTKSSSVFAFTSGTTWMRVRPSFHRFEFLPKPLRSTAMAMDHLAFGAAPTLAARRRAAQVALIHLDVARQRVLVAAGLTIASRRFCNSSHAAS